MNLSTIRKGILIFWAMCFISTVSVAQLLTFKLRNEAASGCANNMVNIYYAFDTFSWDASTSDSIISENMTSVADTGGLSYASTTFTLKYYKHINVVDPNADPTTSGERGDFRIYADGTITISEDGNPKLVLTNCLTAAKVYWPEGLGGPGDSVAGWGWGIIDVASSDASWVSEFDENGTGQVYVEYTSVSNVIQAQCGSTARYNFTLNFYPSSFSRDIHSRAVQETTPAPIKEGKNRTMATAVDMSEINLSFLFSEATNGGQNNDKNDLYGEFRDDAPGGAKPATINSIGSSGFWVIGTTLSSFTTSLTFDLTNYDGINDINDIRMLRRETEDADWEIYASQAVVNNTIVCSDVNSFSHWSVGSVGSDPLAVELTSFTANAKTDLVVLNWKTATEVDNYGFSVERKLESKNSKWKKIGFVDGHGNSNSPNDYLFVDSDNLSGTVQYRLKQIDFDGAFEYSDVVTVKLTEAREYKLAQNYPNPFNPTTVIEFSIPNVKSEMSNVKLVVSNILGEEVAVLINKPMASGAHSVSFDASNLPSGIYFYSISVNGFTQVKKMNLIK